MTAGVLKKKKRKKAQKHTIGYTERFLIRQNETECTFSGESSSSKPRTRQKQTNKQTNKKNLGTAGWVLPKGCVHDIKGPDNGYADNDDKGKKLVSWLMF